MSAETIKENIKTEIQQKASMFNSEEINQLANSLGKYLKSFLSNKQVKLEEVKSHCETSIRDKPLTSAITAFAAGVVIGLLIKKR